MTSGPLRDDPGDPGGPDRPPWRVLVLGANGPTGRRTVRQALDRGYEVVASTRRPDAFPVQHARLRVVGGDATDPAVVDAAIEGCTAVVSVIGAAWTRQPVSVYSGSVGAVVAAMRRTGCRRLLAVTSSGVTPAEQRHDLSRPGRVFHRLARRTIARTVYDDMDRMEAVVRASGLDWTIVRPPGLTDAPGRGYAVAEDVIEGGYCARDDLAAMLLDQLDDTRYRHRVAAVTTPGLRVGTVRTIRTEVLKR